MKIYKGEVISEGVAVGIIRKENKRNSVSSSLSVPKEKRLLEKAIEVSLKQIEKLKEESLENKDYLDIQTLLISDYVLKEKAFGLIEKGYSASFSVDKVLNEYAIALSNSTSSYLQQRELDILDIRNRILENMDGKRNIDISSQFIYFAGTLHPSFLIQNKHNLLGVVTTKGGYSSHASILCRQLNIPYMICDIPVEDEMVVVLDTRKQQIILSPDQNTLTHYESVIASLAGESFKAVPHSGFGFYANVSDNLELDKVIEYDFDGIGLYRTEMIFMNTNRPYTFEEQLEIYSEAVEKLKEKPICFRTFDIGDDKQLSYVRSYHKGIDNYIHNPELFETQIKALLEANRYNSIKIMFPMIFDPKEFMFLKKWVLEIKEKLHNQSTIQIGMMLETKEAMEKIEEFKEVDFISIGTNDLVLSIYHIQRDIQKAKLDKYISDLILKIKSVLDFCEKKNIVLSICGELAAITPALEQFMTAGVKNFSVASPAIKVLNYIYKKLYQ